MPIAQNLRANVQRSWAAGAEVVFATFDSSCRRDEQRSRKAKKGAKGDDHPLPFVVYSRLTEKNSALSHCSRDMDSITRAVWTWEIIKVPAPAIRPNRIFVTFLQARRQRGQQRPRRRLFPPHSAAVRSAHPSQSLRNAQHSYINGGSMALTPYTSSHLVFCDACEQPHNLQVSCSGFSQSNIVTLCGSVSGSTL